MAWEQILAVCGGIAAIGGAVAVIAKWVKPAVQFSNRLSEIERKQQNDYKAIKELQQANEHVCKGVFALLNHEITGNSVENLKRARDEMQDYLIEPNL